ncbi:MAG: UDP-N-acetylglucosamine 2-epimerase (non-hydrolyzing) [Actinomycetota bacterium]|nr:UDP-N-acetylglucosamine 2-epimerase (non-hydrolyzing) [Actinomycetota bacterium]
MSELPDRSVAVVLGTRPEIVKLAGLVRLLGPAARVVYTGQHYDPELSGIFFDEFDMPRPDVHVEIGGKRRGTQIGRATEGLDALFAEDRPLVIVVQGDTNTVAAGALAANAAEIPLVHVEAGLRSFDRRMPEEHNRVIADHLADRCLAATDLNRDNLLAERIDESRIAITGNTVVEAVERLLPTKVEREVILKAYGVGPGRFVLSTFHRPENVDDPETLRNILTELAGLPTPVLLPLHPRTVRRVEEFGFGPLLNRLTVVDPIGYRDFLALGAESAFLVSDSGGVQEEVSVYKRPLIVVRRSTERPEVLGTFARLVEPGSAIGAVANDWIDRIDALHHELAAIRSPYGDASAPQRCVEAIASLVDG